MKKPLAQTMWEFLHMIFFFCWLLKNSFKDFEVILQAPFSTHWSFKVAGLCLKTFYFFLHLAVWAVRESKNNKSDLQPACLCGLTPAGHLYFGFGRKSTLFWSGLWFLRLKFLSKAITATFKTRPRALSPPVLRSGIPRQSEPGPQDLPVGRVQPGDVSPRGSGHHRERRGQSGPEERPAEVHGDVPHSLLPAGQIWLPAAHGRRGTSFKVSTEVE